jgi:transposase
VPGPLPDELRKRVITEYHNGEGSIRALAVRFDVQRTTISEWLALERETGSLSPRPMGGARTERKVNSEGEEFLKEVLVEVPDSTLPELTEAYEDVFGVEMDKTTMGRTLRRMGYTKKKRRRGHLRSTAQM